MLPLADADLAEIGLSLTSTICRIPAESTCESSRAGPDGADSLPGITKV